LNQETLIQYIFLLQEKRNVTFDGSERCLINVNCKYMKQFRSI